MEGCIGSVPPLYLEYARDQLEWWIAIVAAVDSGVSPGANPADVFQRILALSEAAGLRALEIQEAYAHMYIDSVARWSDTPDRSVHAHELVRIQNALQKRLLGWCIGIARGKTQLSSGDDFLLELQDTVRAEAEAQASWARGFAGRHAAPA